MSLSTCIVIVFLASYVQSATILFEGRIPKGTRPDQFDTGATPYNPRFVHGQNQTWSDIIKTDDQPSSLFDGKHFQALELSLTHESIFVPNPDVVQTGFRRSELLPASGNGLTSGVTTFHFSLMKNPEKPLDLGHEYQLVFVEPNDGTHVFEIKYGTGYMNTANPPPVDEKAADMLRLMSSTTTGWDQTKVLFQTEFTRGKFHNFAVTIDWSNATLTGYYSKGNKPLKQVVPTTSNAVKTPGEFHIGMVKLPIGPTNNMMVDGIQESGINESMIYGGVFVEDSSTGVVSTKPF